MDTTIAQYFTSSRNAVELWALSMTTPPALPIVVAVESLATKISFINSCSGNNSRSFSSTIALNQEFQFPTK
ncbi:hypothetical protein D3C73_1606460 [compost metagenome]